LVKGTEIAVAGVHSAAALALVTAMPTIAAPTTSKTVIASAKRFTFDRFMAILLVWLISLFYKNISNQGKSGHYQFCCEMHKLTKLLSISIRVPFSREQILHDINKPMQDIDQ
jgi:hypothetical protein